MSSVVDTPYQKADKPLGCRAYGSIPHLPGSRRGPADRGISEKQADILTFKTRDKHDHVIVEEKLDGSNCSVAKINGEIIPLQRAGYPARSSPFIQHHVFADWVEENRPRFELLLSEGERCCGEWLALAHGSRYDLPHEPYVVFDIIHAQTRLLHEELDFRLRDFIRPRKIHEGSAISVSDVMSVLEPSGHGAEFVEGAVWRVERMGKVDFLAKYVRNVKVDGCLLPEHNGGVETWNWRPES